MRLVLSTGQTIDLIKKEYTLGRTPNNDIVLSDPSVSREHCRIRRTEEGYVIQDLKSQNGTFVNHKRISEATRLREGDTLRVGQVTLQVAASPAAPPVALPPSRPAAPETPSPKVVRSSPRLLIVLGVLASVVLLSFFALIILRPGSGNDDTNKTQVSLQPTTIAQAQTSNSGNVNPLTPLPPLTAPVVDLPSLDGGNGAIKFEPSKQAIKIQAIFTAKGEIEFDHVDLVLLDDKGKIIDRYRDETWPYCYQSDVKGTCDTWDFAKHDNKWANEAPAQNGLLIVRAIAYTTDGRVRLCEVAFWLDPTGNGAKQPPISMYFNQINPGGRDEVALKALTLETVLDNKSALNVDHLEISAIKYDGTVLHHVIERSPPYCGFGEENGVCKAYVFLEHNQIWPGGAPVTRTMVVLRAIAYSGDKPVAYFSRPVDVR